MLPACAVEHAAGRARRSCLVTPESLSSRSPEPEPPPARKISRLISLLPADEWEAQQNGTEAIISNNQAQVVARTPSRSGHSLHGSTPFVGEEWRSPGSATFLTPGDSKTMQIQVQIRGLRPDARGEGGSVLSRWSQG